MTNRVKKVSRQYEGIWPIINLNRMTLKSSKRLRKELEKLKKDELLRIAKDLNLKGRSKMKKEVLLSEVAFSLAARYAQTETDLSKPKFATS